MPAHDQSDTGPLDRLAGARGMRVQVEGTAQTAADGDAAVLDQLAAIGVSLAHPLFVEVDLELPDPAAAQRVLSALTADGFRVGQADDDPSWLVVEHLVLPQPRPLAELQAVLGGRATAEGGVCVGWRAEVPRFTGDDPAELHHRGRQAWEADDLAVARPLLHEACVRGDAGTAPAATVLLGGVLYGSGDSAGGWLLLDWARREAAGLWGAQGCAVFATTFWDQLHEDRALLERYVRPLLQQAVDLDPDGWGLPAGIELARLLVDVGEPQAARAELRRVAASDHPRMADRASLMLATFPADRVG